MDEVLKAILDRIYKEYIDDDLIMAIILSEDKREKRNLEIIDALYQSVLTSIQFGKYKRAVWYLRAFFEMCKRNFGKDNRERILRSLPDRFII